ncbi:saccharopine dehydrogenase NADP-binding domain-containing protein [Nocardioides sp. SYSU DS0651]|uniref:saccharopine dehydrogenase NADP-binding domain-containing protein n=1 Tax=Nocardioides sp. SYSU DS0651 TaxID=3415955 RepID=UPI003F4B0668
MAVTGAGRAPEVIEVEMAADVVVYGASGHTGRFVVGELVERGLTPVLAGRDPARLEALAGEYGGLRARAAPADDPGALDRALAGAAAVVNCAGPFAVTAAPVVAAALRAGIPYVDVAAEIEANVDTFATFRTPAAEAGLAVVPAMAFFGGLGDLLATAAIGEWQEADQVLVGYGLTSWHPTAGTRAAGRVSHDRRGGRRLRFREGVLVQHDDDLVEEDWEFPEPLGRRRVVAEFTMADVVTIPSHLRVPDVRTFMAATAAADLARPDTPPPAPADHTGRSAQDFVVDVRVVRGRDERRATAAGRDIYAVTAPLAVEAVSRLLAGEGRTTGVASAGAMFAAGDFLRALVPHVAVSVGAGP